MKKQNLQNKYPVFSIEIEKKECVKSNVKEILNFLKSRIEEHPVAQFISIFDHYSHTKKMEEGEIATDILAAEVILFCFGKKLESRNKKDKTGDITIPPDKKLSPPFWGGV